MFGPPRFSTILAATALLAAAAVLVMMAGMDRGSPGGDVAYAFDPHAETAAAEAEAKDAARADRARARRGGSPVRTAARLATEAIDQQAVREYCRTVDYNFNDCVNAHNAIDELQGDCTDCRDLTIWIFYNRSGRITHLSKTANQSSRNFGSLENMGLAGTIPSEIVNLRALEMFDVGNSPLDDGPPNQLTGGIPWEGWHNLTNLTWLALDSNRLSGFITPWLGLLRNLEHLYLYSNQLRGSIPHYLRNLRNLTHLALSSNRLVNYIPSALGELRNLEHLYLSSNELNSAIPSALGNLTNLTHLGLSSNRFNGPIPSELGN